VQNAMEGRGSAIYPNGQRYDGMFSNGRREGRGTIHFTNGAVYEGRFRDDAVDGQGTMKMNRAMVVPRSRKRGRRSEGADLMEQEASAAAEEGKEGNNETENPANNNEEEERSEVNEDQDEQEDNNDEPDPEDEAKQDFLIPISFQSDMTHIHAKAGFTAIGH
jgi:hypothetical protein